MRRIIIILIIAVLIYGTFTLINGNDISKEIDKFSVEAEKGLNKLEKELQKFDKNFENSNPSDSLKLANDSLQEIINQTPATTPATTTAEPVKTQRKRGYKNQ